MSCNAEHIVSISRLTGQPRTWPEEGYIRAPYGAYTDPDMDIQEQARIFRGPVWNYVGLEAEVPNPGDYKTTFIGDTPVVMTRAEDGSLHAMVNRCAHRGSIVYREELGKASVKEALAHPVWRMGPKITIDSATLMNKGLEVIEARYLFGIDYDRIDVVVHPEGLVHAIAEFRDGSMTAQMALPDMKLPIASALAWPERLSAGVGPLPLAGSTLTFLEVDREAFPALDLAYRVGGLGRTFPAVMSAANEVAVAAFLAGSIPFPTIVETVARVVDEHEPPTSVASVVQLDRADTWARERTAALLAR